MPLISPPSNKIDISKTVLSFLTNFAENYQSYKRKKTNYLRSIPPPPLPPPGRLN